MPRSNLLSTATWAVGSFSLALALSLPLTLNAVDRPDSYALAEIIPNPKLGVNGIELSVVSRPPTTQPSSGGAFQFTLRAVNTNKSAATANWTMRLTSTGIATPLSRVPSFPLEIWKQDDTITLAPGESKTLNYTTVSLPANRISSLFLGSEANQIVALTMNPNAAPASPMVVDVMTTAQPARRP
jgi:hypothetical protein